MRAEIRRNRAGVMRGFLLPVVVSLCGFLALSAQAEIIAMTFSGRVSVITLLQNPPATIPVSVGDPVTVEITYDSTTPETNVTTYAFGGLEGQYMFAPGSATVSVTAGGKNWLLNHQISADLLYHFVTFGGCGGAVTNYLSGRFDLRAFSTDDPSSPPPYLSLDFRVTLLGGEPGPALLQSDQLPKSNSDLGVLSPSGAIDICGTSGSTLYQINLQDAGWAFTATIDPASIRIGPNAPPPTPLPFFDDFNRPDGAVGNGWLTTTGNIGGNLLIRSGALSTPGPSGRAGIYRPIDLSAPVTITGTLTQANGQGGALNRYESGFLIGTNGSLSGSGYEVLFLHSDQRYANSAVSLYLNGVQLGTIPSSFQFGASITPTITFNPADGRISGSVIGDGRTFNFDFGSHPAAFPGSNVGIQLEFPDPSISLNPTLDNLSIAVATPPGGGFFGGTVSANYEWPNLGTVLYPSGTAIVGPGVEFPNVGGQNVSVDFSDTGFRITYTTGWIFNNVTPKTFDGFVITDVLGTIPSITGVSLAGTNIPGYDGSQLSFDANHVYVNQLGFSGFAAGSFIDVAVSFAGSPPPLPMLSINSVTKAEGNSGMTPFDFTVTLSATSTSTVAVNFATADGTATAGSDYVAASGTLTFAPGQTSQTITVNVIGDTVVEPDETFFVNLSLPTNATLAISRGTGTIVNDDTAPPPPALPQITTISPASGPAGTAVTITGKNFGASQGTSAVKFDSASAVISAGSWSDTKIVAIAPAGLSGTVMITVTTTAGTSNAVTFSYGAPAIVQNPQIPPRSSITYPALCSSQSTAGTPTKRSAVVLVHGWLGNFQTWPLPLMQGICDQITAAKASGNIDKSEEWDVFPYDWSARALTKTPYQAWVRAKTEGQNLGNALANVQYDHIHFIAHSAGSNLIQTALETIMGKRQTKKPTVQMTFLDAYDPETIDTGDVFALTAQINYPTLLPGKASYGLGATWSEHYVDRRDTTANPFFSSIPGFLANTNRMLPDAFDFDITRVDSNSSLSAIQAHQWPYIWYGCNLNSLMVFDLDESDVTKRRTCVSYNRSGVPYDSIYGPILSLEYGNLPLLTLAGTSGDPCYLVTGKENCNSASSTSIATANLTPTGEPQLVLIADSSTLQSTTGTVSYPSPGVVQLATGSPVWVSFLHATTESFDTIQLDYEFLSSAHGLLSLFVDDTMVFLREEIDASPGVHGSGLIFVGQIAPGIHSVSIRLDAQSAAQSVAQVGNLQTGTTTIVQVQNQAPIAIANAPAIARQGSVVRLDGTASYDPDQFPRPLGYSWKQIAGPPATLNDWFVASPTFTASIPGQYAFMLTVTDGPAFTTSSQVTITVPILGDINLDGAVDSNDLALITSALNKPANGPNDLRDLDSDGMITALDARKLTLLCTRPRCATN